jgi:hypothetical protein
MLEPKISETGKSLSRQLLERREKLSYCVLGDCPYSLNPDS